MKKTLSVADKHQLRIARRTLKLSDVAALVLGGMTKTEACEMITRLTGKPPKEEETR